MRSERSSLVANGIQLFFKGLGTIVPIALTLVIVLWLAGMAERGIGSLIKLVMPEAWYITGMGLVGGILVVLAIGLLTQVWLFRKLIERGEAILDRMPIIKSLYRATKDFVEYFSGDEEGQFNKTVLVRHPTLQVAVLGFITREDFSSLPFGNEGEVAVYLPLSYQVAGYTIFIPKAWCEPVDLPFEDALRLILTAAMTRRNS